MNLDVSGFNFIEQLTLLNSAAIMQLSKKVEKAMSAIDDLVAHEAALSATVNDAVARIRALEEAIKAVPPTNEAAIAEIAARLAHLREYLAGAVYAQPAPEPVVEPAPAPVVEPAPAPAPEAPAAFTPSGAPVVATAAIDPSIGS